MGTKNSPGEFDCYDKLEDDEPFFVLMGRDPQAPDLIRQWAMEQFESVTDLVDPIKRDRQIRKAAEARRCATAMEGYQRRRDDKARRTGQ